MQLFARFEAASGKRIDEEGKTTRKDALINELMLRRYSEREAQIAQEWILLGKPVRFGSLTLADFYPSPEDLASVGYGIEAIVASAERRAESKGYAMGYADAREKVQPRQKSTEPVLIPLADAERMDYERLKGKCEALEESSDALHRKILDMERKRRPQRAFEQFAIPAQESRT